MKNTSDKINHHLWQVGYVKRDTQSLASVTTSIARVETISSQPEPSTIFTQLMLKDSRVKRFESKFLNVVLF